VIDALFPYVAQTRGITVRVSANYLPEQSQPSGGRWFWAYHIRIQNGGLMTVQLLTRRWEIVDARGGLQIVQGEGVIGEQPIIEPGQSYDYVSGCPLSTSSGAMVGSYRMLGEDGAMFDVTIPRFELRAPVVQG
jgi:ApaG protein